MNGEAIYQKYKALKLHFTSNYDYFKYKGNVKQTKQIKQLYLFEKLGRNNDNENLIITALLHNTRCWIPEILSVDNIKRNQERQKILQSLSYFVEQDLNKITQEISIKKLLMDINKETGVPILIQKYIMKEVSLETVCAIIKTCNLFSLWKQDKNYNNMAWKTIETVINNYIPFIKIDKQKIKSTIKKYVN